MGLYTESVPTGAVFNGTDQAAWDNLLSSRANTQASLDISRANDQFTDRTLPGLNNASAAAGDYYGGQRSHDITQATADVTNTVGDIRSKLAQYQTDMTMAGFAARTGVALNMSGT
jgi:hypothetical protein